MDIKDLSNKIVEVEDKIEISEELIIDTKQVEGSKTGFYKEFFPEGQLKSTAWWRKGQLNGELYRYDVFGNLEEHSYYKDGKRVRLLNGQEGIKEQRIDKKLVEVAHYENNLLDGEYRRWDGNRLILHGIYEEGKLIKKIKDGRDFNSLVHGENEMNETLNTRIDYDKYNLSYGRFNDEKNEFIVPAFPGENNIKEFKRIIRKLDMFEDVIYDGSNYYFYLT